MKKINKSNCIMIIVTFIFLSVFSLALTIGSQTTARWLVVLAQTDESLTITTYYPSPMGVYSELQLFPRAAAGTCAADNDEGKMYYDSDSHGLFVCQDVNNVISWQPVGGAGHWDLTGTRLYARDMAWSVGIGTQTPSGRLQVVGDEVRIGDGGTVFFANSDGDLYVENELEVSGIGYINTLNATTVTIKDALNVDLLNTVSGPQITTESDYNYIKFGIPSNGAGGLSFSGSSAYFIWEDRYDNFKWFIDGGAEGNIKMQLSDTGNLWIAGNLTESHNFSDVKLKKNIEPIRGALDKLTQLRGVNFEWIHPDAHGNLMTPSAGLIAQEVEKIFPGWVLETEPLGKDKQLVGKDEKVKILFPSFGFEAYVIEAIKELKTQNEALSAQNASLEARILVLEKKFQE